jgi:hypothetical protein
MTHPHTRVTTRDGRYYLDGEEITPVRAALIECDWMDVNIAAAVAQRAAVSADVLGSVV